MTEKIIHLMDEEFNNEIKGFFCRKPHPIPFKGLLLKITLYTGFGVFD